MRLDFYLDDLIGSLDPDIAKACKVSKYGRKMAIVDYFVDALPEWFEVELGYNDVMAGNHGTFVEVNIFADDEDIDQDQVREFVHGCFLDAALFVYDTQFREDDEDDEDDEDEDRSDWDSGHEEDSPFDDDDREDNPAGKHAFRRGIEIDIKAAQSLLMDHGHYDLAMKVRHLKEFRKTEDLQRFALLIKAHLLSNNHEIGLPKKAIKLREMRDKVAGTLDFQGEQKRTSLYEQTRNEEIASWLRHSVTGAAQQFFGGGRSDNPGKSGFSLYWTVVGAAVGATAMHFTMKPKQ